MANPRLKLVYALLVTLAFALFSDLRAQNRTEEGLRPNAVVVANSLNIRTKYPTLEHIGFLRWEWNFGIQKTTLYRQTRVQILKEKDVADTHRWAFIKYINTAGNLDTGYAYVERLDGTYRSLKRLPGSTNSGVRSGDDRNISVPASGFKMVSSAVAQAADDDTRNQLQENYPGLSPINVIIMLCFATLLIGGNIGVLSTNKQASFKAAVCIIQSLCILLIGGFLTGPQFLIAIKLALATYS